MTRGFDIGRAVRASLYLADRARGMTYSEIAKKHGVTKQRVAQVCAQHNESKFRKITEDQCVYANLRQWMNSNMVCRTELLRRIGTMPYGSSYNGFRNLLLGRGSPTKHMIDALIRVTGMSYEEIFAIG